MLSAFFFFAFLVILLNEAAEERVVARGDRGLMRDGLQRLGQRARRLGLVRFLIIMCTDRTGGTLGYILGELARSGRWWGRRRLAHLASRRAARVEVATALAGDEMEPAEEDHLREQRMNSGPKIFDIPPWYCSSGASRTYLSRPVQEIGSAGYQFSGTCPSR